MVEVGFFYSVNNFVDVVCCFVCFKEFEGWEFEDNLLYVSLMII